MVWKGLRQFAKELVSGLWSGIRAARWMVKTVNKFESSPVGITGERRFGHRKREAMLVQPPSISEASARLDDRARPERAQPVAQM